MLSVVFSVLMLAVFFYGLLKKWQPTGWTFAVTLLFGAGWFLLSSADPSSQAGSGPWFAELMGIFERSAISQFGSVILCIGTCMGYIAFIDQIDAPKAFTYSVAAPLRKLNRPGLVCALAFLITALVKYGIPAPASVLAMMLVTLYPILLSLGIRPESAACCIILGSSIPWGPSNSFLYVAFSNAGLDMGRVPVWAVTSGTVYMLPLLAVGMIAVPISCRIFDRRPGGETPLPPVDTEKLAKRPKIFRILPLLPLLTILVSILIGVEISMTTSIFISLLIASAIWYFCDDPKPTFAEVLERFKPMYQATGRFLGETGFLLIMTDAYATVLNRIGGLTYLVDHLSRSGISPPVLFLTLAVLTVAVCALTGATIALLPVFAPLYATAAALTRADPYVAVILLMVSVAVGGTMGLIYMCNVIAAPVMGIRSADIVRRNAIPAVAICFVNYLITVSRLF